MACTLDCEESIRIKACGGQGPYTWTKTGNCQLSATEGIAITVLSTATGGGGTPGVFPGAVAFAKPGALYTFTVTPNGCGAPTPQTDIVFALHGESYDCDGGFITNALPAEYLSRDTVCVNVVCASAGTSTTCLSSYTTTLCDDCAPNIDFTYTPSAPIWSGAANYSCNLALSQGGPLATAFCSTMADVRTQTMKDGGCGSGPCSQGTTTVTVTDAVGVQATVILHA